MIDTVFGWALLLFAPLVFAYAGSSDLFNMKISNKVALLLLLPFPLFAWGIDLGWEMVGRHVLTAVIVLVVTYIFWQIGSIGGGDAKFTAVAALWLGPEVTLLFVALASIYGAVLAVIFLLVRARPMPMALLKQDWIERLYTSKRIPYGIALSAAGLHIYAQSDWMRQGIELLS
ncbi:MAG: prepilin peptidase [Cohaesibacter sp.]|jgi:prepilin peptidase CpaA|nr:prepilin peptidase [Cohaesibacter sp.]